MSVADWHAKMFVQFRIEPAMLEAAGVESVKDVEARDKYGFTQHGDLSGVIFPYFVPAPNGNGSHHRVTARLRRDHPEVEDGKPKNKYICPFGDVRHLYFPPGAFELLADPQRAIVFVEAEKSVLAGQAWAARAGRKLLFVGLGGCWGWRGRIGKAVAPDGARVDELGPLPDLERACGRSCFVLFDSNVGTNPKVQAARGDFVAALRRFKASTVTTLDLPPGTWNGPDDFLAVRGDEALGHLFDGGANRAQRNTVSPWIGESIASFLNADEDGAEVLFNRILFRATITEIFSPRGTGKTLVTHHAAVQLARQGHRVLLLDRDNPRHVVRSRLRGWGADAELTNLKVITRENCPPLTDTRAWAEFPYYDYDVVIVDSLDSAAEGVGEQDSSKPSRAIAPILDIARRDNGPAVLVLGNCIKSGAHSRGSGVIEDRADIVYEVRDATDFRPSGKKSWVEELPSANASDWASRSSRRKRRETYRLAFIPTKFRIGEEPEPFAFEIDTTTTPWCLRDVTDDIDREGMAERERLAREVAAEVESAVTVISAEILRREAAGEPPLLKKHAENLIAGHDIKQKVGRQAINSGAFVTENLPGPGHPKALRLGVKKDIVNRNTPPLEPALIKGFDGADFGCPHPEHPTEIPPQETQCSSTFQKPPISVEHFIYSPPEGMETESLLFTVRGDNSDEVEL